MTELGSNLPSPAASASQNDTVVQRGAVWTRHWASGASHSCARSFGPTYEGSIGEFWQGVLREVRTGERVLDIATGNGPIPRMLLSAAADRVWTCDAVDIANVYPAWLDELEPEQRARMRFHAEVSAEDLPFPNAHFDLVVSQFGIEYADLERALPELIRACRPNGRVALAAHHVESRPVQLACEELAHIEWMLNRSGLFDSTRQILEPLARSGTAEGRAALAHDGRANAARTEFNSAQAALTERISQSEVADVLYETRDALAVCTELALVKGEATAKDRLHRLETQLLDAHWRLMELRSHALDKERVAWLRDQLASRWPTVQCDELVDKGWVMAWVITALPSV